MFITRSRNQLSGISNNVIATLILLNRVNLYDGFRAVMKSFDGAFVTALLVTTLVTPVVTEPFCKTPSESEAYRANTPVVSQWRNGHFSVEVTIPKVSLEVTHRR